MDSPQSVVSPATATSAAAVAVDRTEVQSKEAGGCYGEPSIGVLDVFIHQARDIQNICIYHKQDVYAKICLTSDPDRSVSTKIINGGGINPVFNDNLKLNVRTIESSLKCEVWMLSRVKNYLEDQLLGFALIPLSEIIIKNGNMIEKEFCLSSTDLFHSPSGFVRLSLAYSGTGGCPELISFPANETPNDSDILKESELDKIEFPDPKVVNENQMMVSEYYGYTGLESQTPVEVENDEDNQIVGVNLVESFSTSVGSPSGSVSINGSDSNLECVSKENRGGEEEAESNGSSAAVAAAVPVNIVAVEVPESKMVQQDIVDMYMKSMQQFTESLAKMKLPPVDVENGSSDSDKTTGATTNKTPGSKVFYGSRAFF
ncbi:uncharacterized protein LOC124910784 [Impatiens glandulifera]|uniref:uncharacterized protein LOC124910784 n=1 Tax=Impatiens glandulifera TaxID=253017 RepID=UPI001FB0659C|nr:uncharacterized protein LOC124910784 [Impatiens glandulifera]